MKECIDILVKDLYRKYGLTYEIRKLLEIDKVLENPFKHQSRSGIFRRKNLLSIMVANSSECLHNIRLDPYLLKLSTFESNIDQNEIVETIRQASLVRVFEDSEPIMRKGDMYKEIKQKFITAFGHEPTFMQVIFAYILGYNCLPLVIELDEVLVEFSKTKEINLKTIIRNMNSGYKIYTGDNVEVEEVITLYSSIDKLPLVCEYYTISIRDIIEKVKAYTAAKLPEAEYPKGLVELKSRYKNDFSITRALDTYRNNLAGIVKDFNSIVVQIIEEELTRERRRVINKHWRE